MVLSLGRERPEVRTDVHLPRCRAADAQQQLDVLFRGPVHLLRQPRVDVAAAEPCQPGEAQVDVVARVEEAAAQVLVERYWRTGHALRARTFAGPLPRQHVEQLAVD